jgi:hypothetical protein
MAGCRCKGRQCCVCVVVYGLVAPSALNTSTAESQAGWVAGLLAFCVKHTCTVDVTCGVQFFRHPIACLTLAAFAISNTGR